MYRRRDRGDPAACRGGLAPGNKGFGKEAARVADFDFPRAGFGCASLAGSRFAVDARTAETVLEEAWRLGMRWFDTAPWYGNTLSEHRTGAFLRDRPRDEFILTTKVGRLYDRLPSDYDFENSRAGKRWPGGLRMVPRFDYTYDGILRSYEDSIQRLGINRFDGLAIHDLDSRHHGEEAFRAGLDALSEGGGYRALDELKGAGEISAIGVGINLAGFVPHFLERFPIDYFIVAMPYTLLDQAALADEFPLCEQHGSKVIVGAPFASGILATGAEPGARHAYQPASADILARVSAIEAVCARHNVPLPAAALQFPLAHPVVAAVLFGADSPAQVAANIGALDLKIPAAFWAELKSAGLIVPDAPVAGAD